MRKMYLCENSNGNILALDFDTTIEHEIITDMSPEKIRSIKYFYSRENNTIYFYESGAIENHGKFQKCVKKLGGCI